MADEPLDDAVSGSPVRGSPPPPSQPANTSPRGSIASSSAASSGTAASPRLSGHIWEDVVYNKTRKCKFCLRGIAAGEVAKSCKGSCKYSRVHADCRSAIPDAGCKKSTSSASLRSRASSGSGSSGSPQIRISRAKSLGKIPDKNQLVVVTSSATSAPLATSASASASAATAVEHASTSSTISLSKAASAAPSAGSFTPPPLRSTPSKTTFVLPDKPASDSSSSKRVAASNTKALVRIQGSEEEDARSSDGSTPDASSDESSSSLKKRRSSRSSLRRASGSGDSNTPSRPDDDDSGDDEPSSSSSDTKKAKRKRKRKDSKEEAKSEHSRDRTSSGGSQSELAAGDSNTTPANSTVTAQSKGVTRELSREKIITPMVARSQSTRTPTRRPSIDPSFAQHEKVVELAREVVNRYRKGTSQHAEAVQALVEAEAMLAAMKARRQSGSSDSNTRSRCNTFRADVIVDMELQLENVMISSLGIANALKVSKERAKETQKTLRELLAKQRDTIREKQELYELLVEAMEQQKKQVINDAEAEEELYSKMQMLLSRLDICSDRIHQSMVRQLHCTYQQLLRIRPRDQAFSLFPEDTLSIAAPAAPEGAANGNSESTAVAPPSSLSEQESEPPATVPESAESTDASAATSPASQMPLPAPGTVDVAGTLMQSTMVSQMLGVLRRTLTSYWAVHDDQSRLEDAVHLREADAVNTCQRQLIDLLQAEAEARAATQATRSALHSSIDHCIKNLERVRLGIDKVSKDLKDGGTSTTTTTTTAAKDATTSTGNGSATSSQSSYSEAMFSSLLALHDSTEELAPGGSEDSYNLLSGNNIRSGTIPLLPGLRSASVDELIELMTSELCEYHVQLQRIFLMTYRYFVSLPLVLQKLVMRYCIAPPAPLEYELQDSTLDSESLLGWSNSQLSTRQRVLGMMQLWISDYYLVDFVDQRNRRLLLSFLENTVVYTGFEAKGRELIALLDSKQRDLGQALPPPPPPSAPRPQAAPLASAAASVLANDAATDSTTTTTTATTTTSAATPTIQRHTTSPPPPHRANSTTSPPVIRRPPSSNNLGAIEPVAAFDTGSMMHHLSPSDLARLLTYAEYKMFQSLRWNEFIELRWSKATKDLLAPHISQNTQHFNRVGLWVVHSIVSEAELNVRASILRRFIIVALHLYKLNNFQGVMEILAGLQATPVSRLRRTWHAVGWDMFVLKQTLHLLFHSNYIFLRREIAQVGLPCIPYLGMYLKDLTFIEDGNSNVTDDGLVNFWKFQRIYATITEILTFQKSSYDELAPLAAAITGTTSHQALFQQLERLPTVEYDDAYQLSLRLESNSDIQQLSKFNYDLLEQPGMTEDAALQKLRSLRSHPLLLRRETSHEISASLSSSPPNAQSPLQEFSSSSSWGDESAGTLSTSPPGFASNLMASAASGGGSSGSSLGSSSLPSLLGNSSGAAGTWPASSIGAGGGGAAAGGGGSLGSTGTTTYPTLSSLGSNSHGDANLDFEYVMDVHMCMRNPHTGIKLKNRKSMLRNYPNSFSGAEAVAWMQENLNMRGATPAEQLGNCLLSLGLIRSLTGDEKFRDKKNSFFTFSDNTFASFS